MRKVCKCGNVLSDIVVPNKVKYWTFSIDEWNERVNMIKGSPWKPGKFRSIWYCEKCNRFYNMEPTDLKQYVYKLEKYELENIDCTCREELKQDELEKFYSMNDFELEEIEDKIRKGEMYNFPRDINFCFKCKRVYIRENGKLKVFSVEDVTDLKVE